MFTCISAKKSTETEKVKKENNSKLRRQEIQYLV